MPVRYLVDKETSIRIHEPVRSPRPTFADGDTLVGLVRARRWEITVLAIVVVAFMGFIGVAVALSR